MSISRLVKILGLTILIVSLVGLAVLPFYRVTSKAQNVSHNVSVSQSIKEDNDALRYQIDVSYPQFSGIANTNTQNQINQYIKKEVTDQIDRFKAELPKASPAELKDIKSTIAITYTVVYADELFISIDARVMTYFVGAAHPSTIALPLNYDVQNSKPLTLSALFKANSDYVRILSGLAVADLQKKFPGMDDWIIKGAGPKEENFQKFLIKNNVLVILFDPYQVAAGVAGIQQVSIPASELASILAKPL